MSELPERIAYDESLRGIELQVDALNTLQSRASTLLAAAAVVTAFLGGQALRSGEGTNVAFWLAAGCFAVLTVLVLWALLPAKWDWRFGAENVISEYVDDDAPTDEILRDLALWQERHIERNEQRLDRLACLLRWASALLGAEVLCWLLFLTER